jgi:hypothetical protein
MTLDDVMIVQGFCRPGFVSQRAVAGVIHVDRLTLMRVMRRVGSSWTRSTRENLHGVIPALAISCSKEIFRLTVPEILMNNPKNSYLVLICITRYSSKMNRYVGRNPMLCDD